MGLKTPLGLNVSKGKHTHSVRRLRRWRASFENANDGIALEDALQVLSDILLAHANQDLYEIDPETTALQVERELREWIDRGPPL